MPRKRGSAPGGLLLIAVCAAATLRGQAPQAPEERQSFRFRTGVELVNVTATVSDVNGRFVSGLRKDDFRVYQDDVLQPVTHFDSERVPVSLGIVLDTSGSMAGEKMLAARAALDRFLYELLDRDDEVFLYRFDTVPRLVEGWTTDRGRISAALARIQPRGGTAMYDAIAEALPLVQSGKHRKKAIVLISDGNDTSSHIDPFALKQRIRESEALVYAIGIDSQADTGYRNQPPPAGYQPIAQGGGQGPPPPRPRIPLPFPFPRPGGGSRPPAPAPPSYPPSNPRSHAGVDEGVNIAALREITDDSGGRTELIRSARDLDPATAGIADELSKQYYLGYPSTGSKDGRWHSIRVEVRNPQHRVRARRGFVATP